MNKMTSDALLQAVAQLRVLFPDWRFGQLIANLITASGGDQVESIWGVDDEQLLAAAQRLIARNSERHTVEA